MAKPLKLKLPCCFVNPFQLCGANKISSSARTPIRWTTLCQLSPINPKALDINCPNNLPGPPPSTPETCIKAHTMIPVGSCQSTEYQLSDWSVESNLSEWKKEVNTLKERPRIDIQSSSFNGDQSFDDMWPDFVAEMKRNFKDKVGNKDHLISYSSTDHSSSSSVRTEADEDNETESLLFSSRSLSFDSSYGFSHSVTSTFEKSDDNKTKPTNNKGSYMNNLEKLRHQISRKWRLSNTQKTKTGASPVETSPEKASALRQMMADGKVNESVAVVKKSEDPYEDFKRSMLEMILEKQMFEAEDLEELLQCFLSLNSRQYHGVIVEAFTEIWTVLFCDCYKYKEGLS